MNPRVKTNVARSRGVGSVRRNTRILPSHESYFRIQILCE